MTGKITATKRIAMGRHMRFEIREGAKVAIIEAEDAQTAFEAYWRRLGRRAKLKPIAGYTGPDNAHLHDRCVESWPEWYEVPGVSLRPLGTPLPQSRMEPVERAYLFWQVANRRRGW